MLTITLLAACAHRATVGPATLSGGWSSGEVTVFVLVDAATASPVIWVERGEDAELSPARAVVRLAALLEGLQLLVPAVAPRAPLLAATPLFMIVGSGSPSAVMRRRRRLRVRAQGLRGSRG